MEPNRKKELLEAYKYRKPEMGVIALRCKETDTIFLNLSKDTKADFNSVSFKLSMGNHPNKELQALWNQYGAAGFELSVLKTLKYEDPSEDQTAKLNDMLEQCLEENQQARRIWK